MALKPCRECNAQVSTEAEICPHCGVRYPTAANPLLVDAESKTAPTKKRSGCLGAIVLSVILIWLIGSYGSKDSPQSPSSPCKSDWTRCTDNADLVNNYSNWVSVQVRCKSEATKQARYGTPVWPWLSFSTFLKGTDYVATGRVVEIENDAQFQNGFGAMVHSEVRCIYDLKTDRVISVDIAAK